MSSNETSSLWSGGSPFKTVKERVVSELVDAMLDGRLKLDQPMPPEQEMCGRLGVSRVAFREAVKQLEVLGFLRIDRGNGTLVTAPSFSCLIPIIEFLGKSGRIDFGELHQVRLLIEVEAVSLAASRHDSSLTDKLQGILDKVEANFDEENSHVELDYEFHQAILDACPNKLLPLILSPFSAQLRKSRKISFKSFDAAKRTLATHKAILGAIKAKDSAKAASLMRQHLVETAKDLSLSGW